MPPLTVVGSTPILLFGELDQMQGEVWLANPTASDIGVSDGSILVNFATPETGTIAFPNGAAVPAGATRRLGLNLAIRPDTSPGLYAATISLNTSAGVETIPASAVVATVYLPALGPTKVTFSGVAPSSTVDGNLVVRNRGNVPITVNGIPDETLVEVVVIPRALEVDAAGAASVTPAPGPSAGGTVTFTNATPTIAPGDWADVDFHLATPASLVANRHFRVLPRIGNQRFVIDLLT